MESFDNIIENLAKSVQSYLSYLSTVSSLQRLIEESTIRYPFIEYIERILKVESPRIENQLIGFSNKHTDAEFQYNNQNYVFEFKYPNIPQGSSEKLSFELYFNDLVRLAYLNKNHNFRSFFLAAGPRSSFVSNFMRDSAPVLDSNNRLVDDSRTPQGRFNDSLFCFDKGENHGIRIFQAEDIKANNPHTIKKTGEKTVSYYELFKSAYSDKDCFPPNFTISTKLAVLLKNDDSTVAVAIWEVFGTKLESLEDVPFNEMLLPTCR